MYCVDMMNILWMYDEYIMLIIACKHVWGFLFIGMYLVYLKAKFLNIFF